MTVSVRIRKYSERYASQVAQLCNEFQDYLVLRDPEKRLRRTKEYGQWSLERKLKKMLDRRSVFLVAILEDQIVGFVFGTIEPNPPKVARYSTLVEKQALVEELFVTESMRGRGVAKALMNEIEQYFKRKKCKIVGLGVFGFNQNARDMYEHLGYRVRAVSMIKKLS